MSAGEGSARPRRRGGLWRQRGFRLLWTGETTSQVGTAVTSVALPLVALTTLHAGAFVVAVLTAATWLPWLVLGLPAGAWVDRLAHRPVMLTCDAVSAVAFASVPLTAWTGHLGTVQLVAVALVTGAASVFFTTAYQAYLPALVAAADLTEGNAKLTGSRSAAQVVGPGLGGLVAQAAGPVLGLLADAASFAVSFACLSLIGGSDRAQPEPAAAPLVPGVARSRARSLRREVAEGLHLVLADPYLRPPLVFAALANFALTGFEALQVLFLVRTVGVSAATAGILLALGSLGGLAGAALARPLASRWGSARAMVAVVVLGLPVVLLIPLTRPGVGLLAFVLPYAVANAAVVASNIIGASFRQAYVPAAMLGRVGACTMTIAFCVMPLGALGAGALTHLVGVRAALWVIAASGLTYLPTPMRRLRDLPTALAAPVGPPAAAQVAPVAGA